jgi:hypothetical protein
MIAIAQNRTNSPPNVIPGRNSPNPPIILERERIQRRIGDFDWKESGTWAYLSWMFGPKLNQAELISIGELVAVPLRITLDRDARRRKAVMIKWFEENWVQIQPLLWYITLDTQSSEIMVN